MKAEQVKNIMFKLAKVYNYKDMPEEIQRAVATIFYFDNYYKVLHPIEIGKYPNLAAIARLEANRNKDKTTIFLGGYEGHMINRFNLMLENWLKENGAKNGETVYLNLSYMSMNKIYKSYWNKKWPKDLHPNCLAKEYNE